MAEHNVKKAFIMFRGQKVDATYSEETGLWTAEFTAPSESSWNQPGHVYLAEIHAEDLAGNVTVMDSTDETYGDQLKFRVLEKTAPTVVITSPSQDAVIGVNDVSVSARVVDAGGSEINKSSITLKVNSEVVTPSLDDTTETGVVLVTYSASNLSDGVNSIELSATDNDGNSTTATASFVVSTSAPLLSVETPTEGLITNAHIVPVTGTVSTSSEYVTIAEVTVNGNQATIDSSGNFTYDLELTDGANIITVIAKDSLGKTTSITRNVTLDREAPVITDVQAVSTTVDASGMIRITFRVTDA